MRVCWKYSLLLNFISMLQQQYMLNRINHVLRSGFTIEKKLFVYDKGEDDWFVNSGIRATIFGPTGLMGKPIAAKLGTIGSHLVMPVDKQNFRHYEYPKELKVAGHTHKTWVQYGADLTDQRFIEDMIKNSNVVINLVGPRRKLKKREDFEYVNIDIAERIAKACAKKGILRLIHFSAAGAEQDSPSLDFQTKWQAEKAVLAAFPDATIFRPCTIYGQNDVFAHVILRQLTFFFNHFVVVYDDCKAKKQPIREHDVALAVLNALKLQQTKGKTYELGGPHVLSMLEIHEIIFNYLKLKPTIAYFDRDLALAITKRIYNWQFFGQEVIKKKSINEVVSGKYGTIQDLHIDPVSFKNGIHELLAQNLYNLGMNDQDTQN